MGRCVGLPSDHSVEDEQQDENQPYNPEGGGELAAVIDERELDEAIANLELTQQEAQEEAVAALQAEVRNNAIKATVMRSMAV